MEHCYHLVFINLFHVGVTTQTKFYGILSESIRFNDEREQMASSTRGEKKLGKPLAKFAEKYQTNVLGIFTGEKKIREGTKENVFRNTNKRQRGNLQWKMPRFG